VQALLFLVETLLGFYQLVLLLRLLLQFARADFRNPIARAIVRLTNPVIVPLRRVLPPAGRIDSASVVAILAASIVKVLILLWLGGLGVAGAFVLPPWIPLLRAVAVDLVRMLLQTWFFAILLYAVLSMVAPGTRSPAQALLASVCEPILSRIRRVIPPIADIDLSPLWAGILIQALLLLVH
jgi:YggT family protein